MIYTNQTDYVSMCMLKLFLVFKKDNNHNQIRGRLTLIDATAILILFLCHYFNKMFKSSQII